MYTVVILIDGAGSTEACVALDVVDGRGPCIQAEILHLVESVIVSLESLRLPCGNKDVIIDFGISRSAAGVLYIGKVRVLNEIAAGCLLGRRHN